VVLTVLPARGDGSGKAGRLVTAADGDAPGSIEFGHFRAWLGTDAGVEPEVAVGYGVPGIEIGRVAALKGADLIVLGRRSRGPDHRLTLGETADALVRRSSRPVLFVPEETREFQRMVVALDGTDRCIGVLEAAVALAPVLGRPAITVVTVEPMLGDEVDSEAPPARGRSLQLRETLGRQAAAAGLLPIPLAVRRGDVVDEILDEVTRLGADLLAVGYRRGGPPKVVGPTEIARNLLYSAPCAVLTVPL
jgi:nucleotide-binding universal stress UspA family protein